MFMHNEESATIISATECYFDNNRGVANSLGLYWEIQLEIIRNP